MHALSDEQSELTTHSGLQFGGVPIISGRQEQWHLSPICLGGLLLGPQGLGSQGSSSTTGAIAKHAKIISDIQVTFKTYALEAGDMQWKGLQYSQTGKHSLVCGLLLGIVHCFHSVHWGTDPRNAGFDRPWLRGIQNLSCTPVCRLHKDPQNSQGCIDRTLQVLVECKQHCFHREMDCRDQLFQL